MKIFFTVVQVPYRLHAVLVHEGQANAGHYWAYIHDPQHRCWLKYNDISVTKSSWEELVRDSFGGYRNASAYCLMYINEKKPFLVQGNNLITLKKKKRSPVREVRPCAGNIFIAALFIHLFCAAALKFAYLTSFILTQKPFYKYLALVFFFLLSHSVR